MSSISSTLSIKVTEDRIRQKSCLADEATCANGLAIAQGLQAVDWLSAYRIKGSVRGLTESRMALVTYIRATYWTVCRFKTCLLVFTGFKMKFNENLLLTF